MSREIDLTGCGADSDSCFITPTLYVPPAYVAADPAWIVRVWPFANVISPGLHATSTPLFFETDDSTNRIVGHLSRNNTHASLLEDGQPVLAIFSGPDAYISPRWYIDKPNVPTWDYVAAHMRGRMEPLDDEQSVLAVLARTAEVMEAEYDDPWTLERAPPGRVEFLLRKIRAFRIHVERIEGVTKLSQTQPIGDRHRIISALSNTEEGAAIAGLMSHSETNPRGSQR